MDLTIEQALQQGLAAHKEGKIQEAERLYSAILQSQPAHADANHNLGLIAVSISKVELALPFFKTALEANPKIELFWLSYIDALIKENHLETVKSVLAEGRKMGLAGAEVDALEAQLKKITKLVLPKLPKTKKSLTLKEKRKKMSENKQQKKLAKGKVAKSLSPSQQTTSRLLEHYQSQQYIEAEKLALSITQQFPKHQFVWKVLGAIFGQTGRKLEAVSANQRAVKLAPQDAEAHSNLGVTLQELGRLEEAEESCQRAIALKPNDARAHYNLGITLVELGRYKEAEASYSKAIALKLGGSNSFSNLPGREQTIKDAGHFFAEAYTNLAGVLQTIGRLDEAVDCYRQALSIKPELEDVFGNLLFTLNYHPDKSAEEIFAAYQEYDDHFGVPYHNVWRDHPNDRETLHRLKVGYVSPDFCLHSVRHFLEPLLAQHDKQVVEVYAYADLMQEDEFTARYKSYVEHWIPTVGLSDAALSERIRADGIDILVDLAGHTAKNRLGVFARKPAPVSMSWLGYGYTTGLTAIDYYLSDTASIPLGSEGLFSETPWRLETPCYAYRPAEEMISVSPLPAIMRGFVTFGTLTRSVRINHRTVRVWSEILKQVVGARLVIDSKSFQNEGEHAALIAQFSAQGINLNQLEIGYHSPPWGVLQGLDIGLDCFPHNSGTTLFETLYMGIPFVTLAGRPSVGRIGSSILEGVGYPEWIARTEAEYIKKAVALANDLPALAHLRAGLRKKMAAGPLMDEAGFARKVEAAYHAMFAKWSAKKQ